MTTRNDPSAREPFIDEESQETELNETAAHVGPENSPCRPVSIFQLFRFTTRQERCFLAVVVFCAIAQGASNPLMSFFMKDLFSSIFEPNDDGTFPPEKGPHPTRDEKVLRSFWTFVYLAIGTFVVSGINQIGFARIADRICMRVRNEFFNKLLSKDVGWYDTNSSAEMATRLTNDSYDLRVGIGEKFAQLLAAIVMTPSGFVVAFIQDWRLSLVMLGAIPFMGGFMGVAMKLMAKSAAQQQGFYAKAGGVAETTISAVRTVAAFNGYQKQLTSYNTLIRDAEKNGARAGWINGITMGSTNLIIYFTFALGFWFGSILVVSDYDNDCWKSDPPFGTCFTGATMLSTLFAVLYGGIGIGQAAPGFACLTAAKAAAARIYDIIDEPPAFDETSGDKLDVVHGTMSLKDVIFSYPTRLDYVALNSVTLEVQAGKTAAFVGPSGSGKSTIICLLQRFYDPKSGQVCLDGHDIKTLNLTWLRSKMALVQQEPVLFSGTISQNIGYGLVGADQNAVELAAKKANAHNFIMTFSHKYDTECGERGVQLSGGQKQRIAISRAMVRDPSVLLLDEATSALDYESEKVVQQALDELLKEKARTTVVIAHRLSTIQNADEIFVLENGKLLQSGTHSDLLAMPDSLYSQLVELQKLTGGEQADSEHITRTLSGLSGGRSVPERDGSPKRQVSGRDGTPKRKVTPGRKNSQESIDFPLISSLSEKMDEEPNTAAVAPPEDDQNVDVPMSRLWSMQRDNWHLLAMGLLATIPVSVATPFMGFLFSDASNAFSIPPARKVHGEWYGILDTDELTNKAHKICIEFLALGFIMFVGRMIQVGSFRQAAEALTRYIRYITLQAMLRQEMAWFDTRTSGHLADRLASEAPLIKTFTGESFAALIQVAGTVGAGVGIAIYHSWQLTLASAAFLPILVIGSAASQKAMRQTNETKSGPMVSEAIGNIRTVASFSLREQILNRYSDMMKVEGREELHKSTMVGFSSAYTSGITFVLFGGVVLLANVFINHSWIPPDAVLKVLFPIMFCASGAAQASQWSGDKARARAALNHIFHSVDRTPEIDPYDEGGRKLEVVRGEITYKNVAFSYPSRPDIPIFTDFDLQIKPNTTVAFVGPSGSGKSTTIGLLQRFYNPSRGSVMLDGIDIRELNIQWLRSQMAFVQQEPVLFGGTIIDNIKYGRDDATEEECIAAAKSSNANDFIMNFPGGYNTDVGERGAQLSGGQKQRIAIARSLVRKPAILLLDEATSALDSESEKEVQKALDQLLESQLTTLVVAHRLSTIVNSDMICFIYQGTIVEKGTHSALMKIEGGHYQKLASRQDAKS